MTTAMFQHAPIRNGTSVGVDVHSHSGEFSPWATDLALPSRGISFQFMRTYRSARCNELGLLGRGWTFNYAQRLEREDRDVLYRDGSGRTYRFIKEGGKNSYTSPDGFYSLLTSRNGEMRLRQRYGTRFVFETPESGGRLRSITDRNGNTLSFQHTSAALLATDSFGRSITIAHPHGRIKKVKDSTGRVWHYQYSADECLIEIIQPATDDVPSGPRVRYEYDAEFRLNSVTDPNSQTFLRNFYDEQSRIVRQEHGNGSFEFNYEVTGDAGGFPIYRTNVLLKNSARLVLEHNATGHVIERTLFVRGEALSEADGGGSAGALVPVSTKSEFNRQGELIRRVFPAGDVTEWQYDERLDDPRARGNLLQIRRRPTPGVETDQEHLITQYTYEPKYQRCASATDPRGYTTMFDHDAQGNVRRKVYPNVTVQGAVAAKDGSHPTRVKQLREGFEYNRTGQLTRSVDTAGAVTEYHYYPADDPTGAKGREGVHYNPKRAGGYLARVVRDPGNEGRRLKGKPANLITEFGYDNRGNTTDIWDGKGNPTLLTYDTHDRPVSIVSRAPFNHEMAIRYDANGNLTEYQASFDHHLFDPNGQVDLQSSTLRRRHEYNNLNNVIRTVVSGDGREISHAFTRDASENIIRQVQPMGNVTEHQFDERDLLLEKRLGVGTKDETSCRYTHTPNGALSSSTNGRGNVTRHHYDGFNRYCGFTDAGGNARKQSFDEAGNVTRVEVTGDVGMRLEAGNSTPVQSSSLLQAAYGYDELNRCTRRERVWRDLLTGEPLGRSQWDGQEGVVAKMIEYGDNHRPSKVWSETGNVCSLEYNGANRVISTRDATGESLAIDYDANGNPVSFERLGPEMEQERFRQVIRQEFDELDRLVGRSVNSNSAEHFVYNALGLLTVYRNKAGSKTRYLHDAFGRPTGEASKAVAQSGVDNQQERQLLVRQIEWNDNNYIAAGTNAAGHRTQYQYDALNRREAVVGPDGAATHYSFDKNGNVERVIDPNGNMIDHRFDDLDRLIERRVERSNLGEPRLESYQYDGLDRLVAAQVPGVTNLRRYDSLSRVVEETQAGRTLRCDYDAAGNPVRLHYPSGQEVHKSYDQRRRVSEIRDGDDQLIAQYTYRSSGQLDHQTIGDALDATFKYESAENWLSDITYRSLRDGRVVAGSRYEHDRLGNRTQEAQLDRGDDSGERYFYDSANRLVRVQYGVEEMSDPQSTFEREVTYELTEAGTWRRKIVTDADGNLLDRTDGVTNDRDAYLSLGDRRFSYDPNGNRVVESITSAEGSSEKHYSYDDANRLVRVESLTPNGEPTESLEYAYDAFNRQVRRRVTDANGTHEQTRIWNGVQLIEEWEDGHLARHFAYGARVNEPVRMTRHLAGVKENLFYTFNGRGFITALLNPSGDLAESYHYDVYLQPSIKDVKGNAADDLVSSPAGNPLFAGGRVWDHVTQLYSAAGTNYEPLTGQSINPVAGPAVVEIKPIFIGEDVIDLGTVVITPDDWGLTGDDGGIIWQLDPVSITPDGGGPAGDGEIIWQLDPVIITPDGGGLPRDDGGVAEPLNLAVGTPPGSTGSTVTPENWGDLGMAGLALGGALGGYLILTLVPIPDPKAKIVGQFVAFVAIAGASYNFGKTLWKVVHSSSNSKNSSSNIQSNGNSGSSGGGSNGSGSNGSGSSGSGSSGTSSSSVGGRPDTSSGGGGGGGGCTTYDHPTYTLEVCNTPNPTADDQPSRPGPRPVDPCASGDGDGGGTATPNPEADFRPPPPGVPIDPAALGLGLVATIGGPGTGGPGDVGIFATTGGPGSGGPGDVGRQSGFRSKR